MSLRRLNRTFFERLRRRIRYFYLRLILLPDTPSQVARGLAIGVFVGFLPIVPFQIATVLALTWLLGGSKMAAIIGTVASNPVTYAPLYAAFYYVGRIVTPFGRHPELPPGWDMGDLLGVGTDVALACFFGGLVFAVIFSPPAYFLSLRYLDRLQGWERRKLRNKFDLSSPSSHRAWSGRP